MASTNPAMGYHCDGRGFSTTHTDDLGTITVKSSGTAGDHKAALIKAKRNARIKKIVVRVLAGVAIATSIALMGGMVAHHLNSSLGIPVKQGVSIGVGVGAHIIAGSGLANSTAHSTAEKTLKQAIEKFNVSKLEAKRAEHRQAYAAEYTSLVDAQRASEQQQLGQINDDDL